MEKAKLKIGYFISSFSHGRGGHFYSLRIIAEALKNKSDNFIVCIGRTESPVINQSKTTVYNITTKCFNLIKICFKLRKIIKTEKPDIIHSFDLSSLFFAKLFSRIFKIPLIFTKTAGADPIKFWPKVNDMILFSEENKIYFENNKKFFDTRLFLIPARAKLETPDRSRINLIKQKVDSANVFIRITRIGERYKNGIIQSINLVKKLNSDKIDSCLVLIGVVENHDVLREIINLADEKIIILNEDIYTVNAAELIDIADYVIGTGNNIMEASAISKIILTPSIDGNIPLLINQENFAEVLKYNFELRYSVKNYNEEKNYLEIIATLKNKAKFEEYKNFSHELFDKYFNIENQIDNYIRIYSGLKYNRVGKISDYLMHFYIISRAFLFGKT